MRQGMDPKSQMGVIQAAKDAIQTARIAPEVAGMAPEAAKDTLEGAWQCNLGDKGWTRNGFDRTRNGKDCIPIRSILIKKAKKWAYPRLKTCFFKIKIDLRV